MSASRNAVPPATPEADLQVRILRGESARWPDDAAAGFERRLLDACEAEGTAPLVHHCLRATPGSDRWPVGVREALARTATMCAALDILRERELIAVLAAFAGAGIDTLLLKGAALAHSHYPEPALRTRCDTDVLVRPADRAAAKDLLESLGYRRRNEVSGTLVSYQECHARQDGPAHHVIDLHWEINNGQVFAHALRFDEAYARSTPIPALGASARALCPPHALLLACMHRAAHLGADGAEGNRLIWLYDIHLIARAMTAGEWQDFARMCAVKEMRRISLDAFARTRHAFGTAFPGEVTAALARRGAPELSATYLAADRRGLLLTDLRALTTWTSRATLLRESLFPPATYLLAKYRSRRRWLLPWWYARRAAEGVWKTSRP